MALETVYDLDADQVCTALAIHEEIVLISLEINPPSGLNVPRET
ncbi:MULTISPECIES: hypothetical protein [Acinetobacter]|nr:MULTISPECIES: hypothetical protein [Acinetobacter]